MNRHCMRLAISALALALTLGVAPPAARAAPSAEAQAKELFFQGNTQYKLSNFEKALDLFRRSLALVSRPNTVFNIAQCYRNLKNAEKALFYYKLYLSEWERFKPGTAPPNAGEVKGHITGLEAEIKAAEMGKLKAPGETPPGETDAPVGAQGKPGEATLKDVLEGKAQVSPRGPGGAEPPADVVTVSDSPQDQPRGRRLWTWVAAGVAVAALGAGAGLYVASDSKFNEFEANKDPDKHQELRDAVQTLERASAAMFITGGVAAAGAVVLFILEGRPSARPRRAAGLPGTRILPLGGGGPGLSAVGRF